MKNTITFFLLFLLYTCVSSLNGQSTYIDQIISFPRHKFEANLLLMGASNIIGGQGEFAFDNNQIEIISVENSAALSGFSYQIRSSSVRFFWVSTFNPQNFIATTILKIKFKVKATASFIETPLSLSSMLLSQVNTNTMINPTINNGSIIVVPATDIMNLSTNALYNSLELAIEEANDTDNLQFLNYREYNETVEITKNLTFLSENDFYEQLSIKQIKMNGAGKTLSINANMGITELVDMQNGNIVIANDKDFALRSSEFKTAMVNNANSTNTIQGNVFSELFIPKPVTGFEDEGYRIIGTPFISNALIQLGSGMNPIFNTAFNTAAEPSMTTPFPNVYTYNPSSQRTATQYYNLFTIKFNVPNENANFESGKGVMVRIPYSQNFYFKGQLFNGDLSIPVINNRDLADNTTGFNLLCNPFPSPILASKLIANSTNIDNAIYIDQPVSNYGTTWASIVNGVSVNNASDTLGVHQGFWVRANQNSGTVNFTNAVRVNEYKSKSLLKTQKTAKEGLIKIAISEGNKVTDETVIYFEEGATSKFDGKFDASKIYTINGASATLYSFNDDGEKNTHFSINGLGEFDEDMTLPLGMNIVKDGKHKIVVREIKYFHSLSNVYLYDSLTETLHNLKANPEYEFVSKKGNSLHRFVLLFKSPKNKSFLTENKLIIYPNPTEDEFNFSLKSDNEGTQNIIIYDALGRICFQREVDKQGAFLEGKFSLSPFPKGIYILEISSNKNRITERIIKK
jgi:hypothetical protein